MSTPIHGMPEITANQASKYLTHNEALRHLDGKMMCVIQDKDLVTSPSVSTGDDGKVWIVAGTGGDWSAFSVDDLAHYYDGSWYNYVPVEGWICHVNDEDVLYKFYDSNWVKVREEIYITALEMTKLGSNDPNLVIIKDDGGGSTGVYNYGFDKTSEEELIFSIILSEYYVDGDDINISIIWCPSDTDTGTCRWGLEYTWQNQDSVFGNTSLITTDDTGDGAAYKIQKVDFSSISGTGKQVESKLLCRIYRDASDSSDDYDNDAILLGVVLV